MVDINPKATAISTQLLAQLQGGRGARVAGKPPVDVRPRPQDIVNDRVKDRQTQTNPNRQLPVKTDNRVENLSSAEDIEVARARVDAVAGRRHSREAPIGRTSARQTALRNQPLGQIIDIRV